MSIKVLVSLSCMKSPFCEATSHFVGLSRLGFRVVGTSGEVLDQSMDTCQVEWDTSRERLVGGFEDLKGHFLDVLQTKTAARWT